MEPYQLSELAAEAQAVYEGSSYVYWEKWNEMEYAERQRWHEVVELISRRVEARYAEKIVKLLGD